LPIAGVCGLPVSECNPGHGDFLRHLRPDYI
jgi:hypothetical protein